MFMALRVPALLRLWRCVLSRFFLLLVALIDRYRCYGVMLMALRAFCAFMFAVYGSLYFCAVGVACRCGVMFLRLSFSAASGFFGFFELLKRSTAFLRR